MKRAGAKECQRVSGMGGHLNNAYTISFDPFEEHLKKVAQKPTSFTTSNDLSILTGKMHAKIDM